MENLPLFVDAAELTSENTGPVSCWLLDVSLETELDVLPLNRHKSPRVRPVTLGPMNTLSQFAAMMPRAVDDIARISMCKLSMYTFLQSCKFGILMGGVTVHYGQVSTNASSVFGDGSIDTDGYGFGGTLTWLAQNGFYVDGQVQVTWYETDIGSDMLGRSLANDNDGFGYSLSLETGKRIALDGNWSVTPQAQLAYSNVDFDSVTDPFGARVSMDRSESLKGRVAGLQLNIKTLGRMLQAGWRAVMFTALPICTMSSLMDRMLMWLVCTLPMKQIGRGAASVLAVLIAGPMTNIPSSVRFR